MLSWRDSGTAIVGEVIQAHDVFAVQHLKPRERVLIAATHTVFLVDGAELRLGGPLFVTDSRIVGGQERIIRRGYKALRADLSDVRAFGGGLMRGVGPVWEWQGSGYVDVRVLFRDPLEGERFTQLTERLLTV